MAMRRREPPVPLTIQALGDKLDQLTAGQARYDDLLRRLAAGQEHHAAVLDLHTAKLNELVAGQNGHTQLLTAHTATLNELVAGQNAHTEQLDSHTELLNSHTEQLNSHTEILNSHTEQLNSHTEILNSHTGLLEVLVRGQREQTTMLRRLLQARGGNPGS